MTRITKEELSPSLVQEIEKTVDLTPIETRVTNVESKTTAIGDVSTLVTPIKTDAVAGVNSHILPRTGAFAKHSYYVPNPVITGDVLDISYIADFSTLTTAGQLSGVAFNITFLEEKTAVQFYIKVNDTLTFMLQNKTSEAFVKFEAGTMYTFVCTGTTFLLARGGNGGGSGSGNAGNVNDDDWVSYKASYTSFESAPYDARGDASGGSVAILPVSGQLNLTKRASNGAILSQVPISQHVVGTNGIAYINCVSNDYFEVSFRNAANQNIWTVYRFDYNLNVLKQLTLTAFNASQGNISYFVGFVGDNHLLVYLNNGASLSILQADNYTLRANLAGYGIQSSAHLRAVGKNAWIYSNTGTTEQYVLFRKVSNALDTRIDINATVTMPQLLNHIAQLSGQ